MTVLRDHINILFNLS